MAQPTSTDSSPEERPFPFMKLPPEIRLMVYEELDAVTLHHWIGPPRSHASSPRPGFKLVRFALPIQLLQVSRQINTEAAPILRPKAALIRKMVPKMIVYVNEQEHPRLVGSYVEMVGRWFDALLQNPRADFDDFARLRPREPAERLRWVHQAGIQLLPRYRYVRRRGAFPVSLFQIRFLAQDPDMKVHRRCELAQNASLDQASRELFDKLDRKVHSTAQVVMAAIKRRMQPRDVFENPYVNLRAMHRCGCGAEANKIATVCPGWVPLGHSGSYTATDQTRKWEKFEWACGWVEGELLGKPEK